MPQQQFNISGIIFTLLSKEYQDDITSIRAFSEESLKKFIETCGYPIVKLTDMALKTINETTICATPFQPGGYVSMPATGVNLALKSTTGEGSSEWACLFKEAAQSTCSAHQPVNMVVATLIVFLLLCCSCYLFKVNVNKQIPQEPPQEPMPQPIQAADEEAVLLEDVQTAMERRIAP